MNCFGLCVPSLRAYLVPLLLSIGLPMHATAATVKITEPFASMDSVVSATSSDVPAFEWSASGTIDRFELQLSERAEFNAYWHRSVAGTTRSFAYLSSGWTGFNTSATAPGKLRSGTRYYLRVKALDAHNETLAESAPVSFTARSLASGTYCNPDFDTVNASNVNPDRTRGLHVVSNSRIDRSIRFHVIPADSGIKTQVYDSTGTLLCTLNGGPMLRSREGIPSKGAYATMTTRFDLRSDGYFNRIAGPGPHIPVVLLGDMASLPTAGSGNAASEGIGLGIGNLSNWNDTESCTKPRLTDGDTTGNLTVIESFRDSQVCIFGDASTNYEALTDQTYHVEIRATPVLRGIGNTRNRISYKVTTAGGTLVAERENFVDDLPPTTQMHGGWLLFAVIGGQTSLPPFDLWFENLEVDYRLTVGADGRPIGNDLLVAFGSRRGLSIKKNDGSWTSVSTQSPLLMANGDIDADGVSDVMMDFGANGGLRLWKNGRSWQTLLWLRAQEIVATDLDGNGKSDFVVNFGPDYGLWAYRDFGSWRQIHGTPPRQVVSASLDGDPRRDLVLDFGPDYGIWMYMNETDWLPLHGTSAEEIVVGDLDGNGIDDMVIDFGSQYGIWKYMNQANWVQLHGVSPQHMAIGNVNLDPRKDLVLDFGPQYGIWIWHNDTTWQQIHGTTSEMLGIADLDRNGIDDVIIDFGPVHGLWAWKNGAAWVQQNAASPQKFIAVDADEK